MKPHDQQNQSLKDAIRDAVEHHAIADDLLDELLRRQAAVLEKNNTHDPMAIITPSQSLFSITRVRVGAGLAFALFMIVTIGFWLIPQPDFSQQIASEVVENHLKLKPLDVKTQSLSDIRRFFTALDFSPIHSSLIGHSKRLAKPQLIGGRYCSIKGVTAAQLRYRQTLNTAELDDLSTLYQVPYDPELYGFIPKATDPQGPKLLFVKGLAVTLWVEKGLLLVWVSQ